MKKLTLLVLIVSLGIGCTEEELIGTDCNFEATVMDLTGLDGCGYVLKMDNGSIYEPVWQWGLFCGTPPLPQEILDDPLYQFELKEGQRVRFGFEPFDGGTICMAGTPVIVTCIEEIISTQATAQ